MSFIYSVKRLDEIHIRIFYTLKRISYTIKRILLHINTYVYKSFFTNCPDNVTSSSLSYFNLPLKLLSSNSSCELKCQDHYKCPIRIKIVNILLICGLLTEAWNCHTSLKFLLLCFTWDVCQLAPVYLWAGWWRAWRGGSTSSCPRRCRPDGTLQPPEERTRLQPEPSYRDTRK